MQNTNFIRNRVSVMESDRLRGDKICNLLMDPSTGILLLCIYDPFTHLWAEPNDWKS